MNTTVGPHSSAVYWRRRAVVLGPVLLILFLAASCVIGRGGGSDDARLAGVPASSPAAPISGAVGSAAPTASAGPSAGSPAGSPAVPSAAPPAAGPTGTCADKDLKLTAVPSDGSVRIGEFPSLRLVVTNTSAVTCKRDLGADEQELLIQSGGKPIWSSDDCVRDRAGAPDASAGSVRAIVSGEVLNYYVKWGGTSAAGKCATGAPVAPGKYVLIARLGSLRSAPAPFTVTL